MAIESLISKNMIDKAKTITAVLERKTEENCYFKVFRYDQSGRRHEYSVIYKRDNSIPLRERFNCSCLYCSNYNVLENRMCSYKIATIMEMVRKKMLNESLLNAIINERAV